MLSLNEKKLKGNGEELWCVVKCIIASVQEIEMAMEDMAFFSNDVSHSTVPNFGCARSKILWVNSWLSRVNVCVCSGGV